MKNCIQSLSIIKGHMHMKLSAITFWRRSNPSWYLRWTRFSPFLVSLTFRGLKGGSLICIFFIKLIYFSPLIILYLILLRSSIRYFLFILPFVLPSVPLFKMVSPVPSAFTQKFLKNYPLPFYLSFPTSSFSFQIFSSLFHLTFIDLKCLHPA